MDVVEGHACTRGGCNLGANQDDRVGSEAEVLFLNDGLVAHEGCYRAPKLHIFRRDFDQPRAQHSIGHHNY